MSYFRRFLASSAALAVLIAAAACGTEPEPDDQSPPPTTAAPTASPTPEPEEDEEEEDEPTIVTVTLIDNRLVLAETSFPAGTYTFVAEQQGSNPHALSMSGPGVNETTPQLAAGGSAEFTVRLEPGSYELWCPVPGHRQDGMEVTIEVT